MEPVRIGVIGGSGVYDMDALQNKQEVWLDTPFGKPSDAYIVGELEGQRVAFLSRHSRGHKISPTRLNSRANIWGFKKLGVEYLIAVSACGSLQEHLPPGSIVVPDQLYDRTRLRYSSFFDDPSVGTEGVVVHIRWLILSANICLRCVTAPCRKRELPRTWAEPLSPSKGRASAPRRKARFFASKVLPSSA